MKAVKNVDAGQVSNDIPANDYYQRQVKITHYTKEERSRVAHCLVTISSQGHTVSSPGDTVSKDEQDLATLRRRSEAIGYARCLAKLDDKLGRFTKQTEGESNV